MCFSVCSPWSRCETDSSELPLWMLQMMEAINSEDLMSLLMTSAVCTWTLGLSWVYHGVRKKSLQSRPLTSTQKFGRVQTPNFDQFWRKSPPPPKKKILMQLDAFRGILSQRIVKIWGEGVKRRGGRGSDPQSQEAEQNGGCSDVLLFLFLSLNLEGAAPFSPSAERQVNRRGPNWRKKRQEEVDGFRLTFFELEMKISRLLFFYGHILSFTRHPQIRWNTFGLPYNHFALARVKEPGQSQLVTTL